MNPVPDISGMKITVIAGQVFHDISNQFIFAFRTAVHRNGHHFLPWRKIVHRPNYGNLLINGWMEWISISTRNVMMIHCFSTPGWPGMYIRIEDQGS